MIPYRDLNPTQTTPIVTWLLVATNVGVFVLQLLSRDGLMAFGATPAYVLAALWHGPKWPLLTLVTSAFLHGGFTHLFFNMLFLWIFGDNVEDRMGHLRFLGFYLTAAVIAAVGHIAMAPASPVPMVGASGAISAVLGAYMVLFPTARIKTLFLIIIIIQTVELPAFVFLGIWIAIQMIDAMYSDPNAPGVAWYAHIGGFAFGFLMAFRYRRKKTRL